MDLGELVLHLRLDDQVTTGLSSTQKSITGFAASLSGHGKSAGAKYGQGFSQGAGASMGRTSATLGRQLARGIGNAAIGGIAAKAGTMIADKLSAAASKKLASSKMFGRLSANASKAGHDAGAKVAAGIGAGTSRINWSRIGKVGLAAAAIGAGLLFARNFTRSAEGGIARGLHPGRIAKGMGGAMIGGLNRVGVGMVATAAGVGVGITAALGGALKKGLDRLTAIDSAKGKLIGLGNSAKTVQTIMDNALASVKGTAFGLDDASTVAASAVAAGIKPGKELTRVLKLVADGATIGGSSMSDMGAIFNQVASTNKVYGDTLNQLGEQGIPIVQFLAKEMGVSAEEVSKLASKGKIDFKTFSNAMENGLGGAAKASGDTFKGALANVGAGVSRFGAGLLKGVFPQAKGVFGDITGALDRMGPAAGRIGGMLGKAFGSFLPTLKTFGSTLAGAFGSPTDAVQKFVDFFTTHQAAVFSFLVGGARLALAFGASLLQMAAGALHGFAFITRGMATVQDAVVGSLGSILHASALAFAWVPGIGDALAAADSGFASFAAGSKKMTDFLRGAADGAESTADGIDGMVASMDGAREKLEALAAQNIGGIKKADELNKVKIALRGMPKSVKTQVMTAYKKGGLEAALAKLKELKDKTVRAQVKADAKQLPKLNSELKKLKDKKVKAEAKGDWSQVDKLNTKIKKLKDRIVAAKVKADTKGADDAKNKTSKKNLPDRDIKVKVTTSRPEGSGRLAKEQQMPTIVIPTKVQQPDLKNLNLTPPDITIGSHIAKPAPPVVPTPPEVVVPAKVATPTLPAMPSAPTLSIAAKIETPALPALPKGRPLRIPSMIITPKLPTMPKGRPLRIPSKILTPALPKMPKGNPLKIISRILTPKMPKLPKPAPIVVKTKGDLAGANKVKSAVAGIKPKPIPVKTKADLAGATKVKSAIAGIKPKTVAVKTSANLSGVSSVRSALAGLHDKTVTITTVKKTVGGATGGLFTGSDFRFAGGGAVRDVTRGGYAWGAGNSTDDKINARIARGEVVEKEAAVRYYGADFMLALNRMSIPKEALGLAARSTVDAKPSKAYGHGAPTFGQMPASSNVRVEVNMPTASDTAASHAANVIVDTLAAAGIN